MHPYKRSTRLSLLVKEEVADIILKKVKDPRLGFITVTDVEMTDDLKIARVFISVLQEQETGISLQIIKSAKNMIRSELSRRIRVKFIPSLEFMIDESIEEGMKIDKLLREINQE
ncbi:MAG: 30S ribosome-binding factor RbfA [Thermodesulfovibrionales bacterium]|nr:30S ribosome-binding factor RbfA [Thermodesulfovibrionales bacterium]